MKNIKSYFELNKENRKSILYLILLLASIQLFIIFYTPPIKQSKITELQKEQIRQWQKNIDNEQSNKRIEPFNPNDLKEEEWMKLGFSNKQAQVILKYKKSLGGFSTLAQIKKCFVISDEKFKEIQPYLLLENEQQKNTIDNKKIFNDLNSCDINALVAVGIKRRDTRRIFNYRKSLGGFYSFNQLKEIHLSIEKIALLRKKMILKTSINRLDINSTPLYIFKKHPYISQNFAEFLKSSREKGIKFSSIAHLQKQYKGKISKKLMVYLSF